MRLIGPDEFEKFYNSIEKRMVGFFATKASILQRALALFALCMTVYFSRYVPHFARNRDFVHYLRGGIVFLYLIQDSIFFLLALASASHWLVKPRARNFFFFFACVFVWAITITNAFEYWHGRWEFFFALGVVPYLCLISWNFLRFLPQWKRKRLCAVVFSIAFWLPIVFWGAAIWRHNPQHLLPLLKFKFEFMWLSCLVFAFRHPSADTPLMVALNPINAIQGVIWPYDLRVGSVGERSNLWWSGVWKCTLGYGLCGLSMWLFQFVVLIPPHGIMSFLMNRNFYILSEVAGFNVIVGVTRCFGYSLRDRTNFALLSRSPSEFWQRINVFNYLFVLENINLPLYRLFKSRFISTLGGLLFLMPTHYAIHIWYTFFFPSARGELLTICFQFVLWFFIVYFSVWIPIFSPRRWGSAVIEWLAIFATHALYIFSSFAAYYLAYLVTG